MQIKEIRLTSFKSFADPTDLEIAPGITGIVGPNGCGKSNIVEAVLWAMGETAPGSMRGTEMENVIFAGSTGRAKRSYAEVTLSVDATGLSVPGLPEDAGEIEVTRRIRREAGSTYRINGQEVRARDVQTLFGDAGTGARSCAIVRQNRIGELVNAKPQARRQVLEDAAGIAGLHKRRREVELRIAATRRNIELVEEHVSQLEKQLRSFQRESRRAGLYRGISARIRRTETLLAYARWRKEAELKAGLESDFASAEVESGRATVAASAAARRRSEASACVRPLRQTQIEAAAAYARIRGEGEDLERRIAEAKSRLAASEEEAARLESDIARETGLAEDAERNLTALGTAGPGDAEAESRALQEALAEAQSREAAALERLAAAEGAFDRQRQTAAGVAARHEQLAARESEANESFARMDAEAGQIGRDHLAAVAADRAARAAAEAARTEHATAREETLRARSALEAAGASRSEAEANERAARVRAAEARQQAAALEAERTAIEQAGGGEAEPGEASRPAPILDQLRPDSGLEAALDAALGDDLRLPAAAADAATSGWIDLPAMAGAAPLPEGATPLIERVAAPAALARRLSQTGIVSRTEGARLQEALQPGQRLVSIHGDLWRWDGLRLVAGDARGTIEYWLKARARFKELAAETDTASAAAESTTDTHRAVEAALVEAIRGETAAREVLQSCEEVAAGAGERAARAEAAIGVAAADLQRRVDAKAGVETARGEMEAGLEAFRRTMASDPSPTEVEDAVAAARALLEEVRVEAEGLRDESRRLHREIETRKEEAEERHRSHAAWSGRQDEAGRRIRELEERLTACRERMEGERRVPSELAENQAGLSRVIQEGAKAKSEADDRLAEAEAELHQAGEAERAAEAARSEAREAGARNRALAEAAAQRVGDMAAELEKVAECVPEEVASRLGVSPEEIGPPETYGEELESLRGERERIGPVNLRAEADMREVTVARDELVTEKTDLDGALAKFEEAIESLNQKGRARLLAAFEKVDSNFREVFATLFGSEAKASLELVDSQDPFEAGLEIYAQPPGKRLTSLVQMSGGEKALTALALVFALFLSSQAPLCVLDEVDAPLDDANVQRFCDLLGDLAERTRTRFLVVTHHAITISRMDRLYGVTMAEKGVSQLVSVDYDTALERIAA